MLLKKKPTWTIARVMPAFEKGDKGSPSYNRPI